MLGTVALDQRACLFKLHLSSVHVCSTFSRPAARASADIFIITYVWLCDTGPAYMSETRSSYVCNSFTRLAGMLQYPCFKRCFEPTGMFVAVALDHLARQLQLNLISMHVC